MLTLIVIGLSVLSFLSIYSHCQKQNVKNAEVVSGLLTAVLLVTGILIIKLFWVLLAIVAIFTVYNYFKKK